MRKPKLEHFSTHVFYSPETDSMMILDVVKNHHGGVGYASWGAKFYCFDVKCLKETGWQYIGKY
jgi:hypothetical protein